MKGIILAGGSGTRLWPLSTKHHPKQLLALTGDRSLIQLTVDRTTALAPPERIVILTNARYVNEIRKQLPEVPADSIVSRTIYSDEQLKAILFAFAPGQDNGKLGTLSTHITDSRSRI